MTSDDLSSLFVPNPRGAAMTSAYRVGRLLAFDADDGSNTVVIGSSEINNLPMLVTGAGAILQAAVSFLREAAS